MNVVHKKLGRNRTFLLQLPEKCLKLTVLLKINKQDRENKQTETNFFRAFERGKMSYCKSIHDRPNMHSIL